MRINIVLFVALVVMLTGCGSNEFRNISNHSHSVGTQAVNIVDEFLGGEIPANVARERLGALPTLHHISADDSASEELSRVERDSNFANFRINLDINILSIGISSLDFAQRTSSGYVDERFDQLLETRNNLAERLGIEQRRR